MHDITIPDDRRYATTHEWAMQVGDLIVVGITDYAQDALGDITFVELPTAGTKCEQAVDCCVIESVKAANDMYAPVTGTVAETNAALNDKPELVNTDPHGEGWILKLRDYDGEQFGSLMSAEQYRTMLEHDA